MSIPGDHHVVGAGSAKRFALCRAARHGDDRGARRLGDLDGREPDAAARSGHKHDFAELDLGHVTQRAERDRRRGPQHAGVREGEIFGNLDQRFRGDRGILRVAAGNDAALGGKASPCRCGSGDTRRRNGSPWRTRGRPPRAT